MFLHSSAGLYLKHDTHLGEISLDLMPTHRQEKWMMRWNTDSSFHHILEEEGNTGLQTPL